MVNPPRAHSPNFANFPTRTPQPHYSATSSASLTNAQPLPPFLAAGDSFPLAREMRKVDGELLSIRYIEDPGFSAFVALEVLRSVVGVSLRELLSNVSILVGEVSFNFQVEDEGDEEEGVRLMSASGRD